MTVVVYTRVACTQSGQRGTQSLGNVNLVELDVLWFQ